MDALTLTQTGIVILMILGAAILGVFLQQGCGLILLMGAAAIASGLCLVGARLAGWPGLLAAVGLVTLLGALVGNRLGKGRGARLISLLWLGFCLSCLIGSWIADGAGIWLITLPANLLFWGVTFLFSGFLLPVRENKQRGQAFRSLLTFSLGTNYPYYVMNDRQLEKRVDGNPYRSFFCGPGIVLTDCDHLAVITNGRNITIPDEPGLTFTGRFEVIQQVIDLRPQLKAFPVETHTQDGIPLRVLTFVPFHIHWGGKKPTPGAPFPFQRRAVFQAITSELVEQPDRKCNWEDRVEIYATRIVQDILPRYRFDDLCLALGPCLNGPVDDIVQYYQSDEKPAASDPDHDPRLRIRKELASRLKRELKPFGIEVMGGGISNLLPINQELIRQRIANWQTKWQNRIALMQAEGDAQRTRLVEQARVGVEQDLLVTVSRMLADSLANGEDISDELLAATVVASLEQMAICSGLEERVGQETMAKLAYLRSTGKPLPSLGSGAKG